MLLVDKDPAKEIRAYELGQFLRSRFAVLYERRIQALRRLVRRRSVQGVVGGGVTAVVSGGVLGLLIWFVADGRVSLAGAGAAAAALILMGTQMQGLASGIGQLYESSLFIQDFNNFVKVELAPGTSQFAGLGTPSQADRPAEGQRPRLYLPEPAGTQLEGRRHGHRPGRGSGAGRGERLGQDDPGQDLGGLYAPQEGCITWDGQDMAAMDITEVRKRVAVLFQDFVHYFLSARENIAMGRWELSDDEAAVRLAAARSGASRFLEALPAATTPISVRSSSEVATSPRGSGSGWRSPGRSSVTPSSSYSTNRPPPWTRGPRLSCSRQSVSSSRAGRSC